jgi:hypothetical protein
MDTEIWSFPVCLWFGIMCKVRSQSFRRSRCLLVFVCWTLLFRKLHSVSQWNDCQIFPSLLKKATVFSEERTVWFDYRCRKDEDEKSKGKTILFCHGSFLHGDHCIHNVLIMCKVRSQSFRRSRCLLVFVCWTLLFRKLHYPDLTLKKATDMTRQSESVRTQQSLVRNDLCDSTVDAVTTKTRESFQRSRCFLVFVCWTLLFRKLHSVWQWNYCQIFPSLLWFVIE